MSISVKCVVKLTILNATLPINDISKAKIFVILVAMSLLHDIFDIKLSISKWKSYQLWQHWQKVYIERNYDVIFYCA